METFGSMLERLRLAKNLTQDEVAAALNVTQGYIANLERGRKAGLSTPKLVLLADVLGISVNELSRAMAAAAAEPQKLKVIHHEKAVWRPRTPLICEVPAGRPSEATAIADEEIDLGDMFQEEGLVAYKVRGLSMVDELIGDGDIIVVRPQPEAETGDIVVATISGELTLKMLLRIRGKWCLAPKNRNGDIPVIELEEADDPRILGVYLGRYGRPKTSKKKR